jgi:hypothetical protein
MRRGTLPTRPDHPSLRAKAAIYPSSHFLLDPLPSGDPPMRPEAPGGFLSSDLDLEIYKFLGGPPGLIRERPCAYAYPTLGQRWRGIGGTLCPSLVCHDSSTAC